MEEIAAFKIHLTRLGYQKSTINMLPSCVKEFIEYTQKELQTITAKDIKNYYKHLQERPHKRKAGGLSESYINHHIYSLKVFFAYLEMLGAITENPMSALHFPKPTIKPRIHLNTTQIKALYQATKTAKERAVLSLFYGCGLRRTEGEKLDIKDIHFRNNVLYVRAGKGGKRRAIPLSESVKKDLKNYLLKERKSSKETTAFILNENGTRARGDSLNKILKNLVKRTTVKQDLPAGQAGITLHHLRHSIATHLLENGLSVEYVRDFLGHQHLESTQVYTHVNLQKTNLK